MSERAGAFRTLSRRGLLVTKRTGGGQAGMVGVAGWKWQVMLWLVESMTCQQVAIRGSWLGCFLCPVGDGNDVDHGEAPCVLPAWHGRT